jgi:hypothetical protein
VIKNWTFNSDILATSKNADYMDLTFNDDVNFIAKITYFIIIVVNDYDAEEDLFKDSKKPSFNFSLFTFINQSSSMFTSIDSSIIITWP